MAAPRALLVLPLLAICSGIRRLESAAEPWTIADGGDGAAALVELGRARSPSGFGINGLRDMFSRTRLEPEEVHPLMADDMSPPAPTRYRDDPESPASALDSDDVEAARLVAAPQADEEPTSLPLVAKHFDDVQFVSSGPDGFEVFACTARSRPRDIKARDIEVHVMPLRHAEDRARFKAEVAAHRRVRESYLGWRMDDNASGVSHGLVVLAALPERLADVQLGREKNILLVNNRLRIGLRISSALKAMSKSGFVHGSLDLSQIWVEMSARGRVESALLAHRHAAIKVGTWANPEFPPLSDVAPAYIAPELRGRILGKFKPSTDVYALGAVMYHIFLGYPPDEHQLVTPEFEALQERYPAVGHFLQQCLEPDPYARITLIAAAARLRSVFGLGASRRLEAVARDHLTGLPSLEERPPGAGEESLAARLGRLARRT